MSDVPARNVQRELDRPHMEIIDLESLEVWQVMAGVTRADFDALAVEPPYAKVGIGVGAMDEGWFARSPGAAEDGPAEERELFGHRWIHCASPLGAPALPAGPDGPRRLQVDKHHVLVYRAERELGLLTLPDGSEYVHVIDGGAPLVLPEGWVHRTEKLAAERTIRLPNPTTVFFFPNGDSYQGPL